MTLILHSYVNIDIGMSSTSQFVKFRAALKKYLDECIFTDDSPELSQEVPAAMSATTIFSGCKYTRDANSIFVRASPSFQVENAANINIESFFF